MGHREELMAAARRCLEKRGYARTTSRHLAAEAGAPLGTINYHYGSKEALLNAALMRSVREWGDRMHTSSGTGPADDDGDIGARLERLWSRVLDSQPEERPMLVATLEAFTQAEHSEEVRRQIADEFERARPEMAALLHGIGGPDDPEGADTATARAVGSVHMALVAGLTQQWLIDPERAPSAAELANGLRAIARSLDADPGSHDSDPGTAATSER